MTTRTTLAVPTLVTVEIMPEWIRASHEAAGYAGLAVAGRYPYNGAVRVEVSEDEAQEILDEYGRWARIIENARPAPGVTRSLDTPWPLGPAEHVERAARGRAAEVEVEDQDEPSWPPASPASLREDFPF